MTVFPKFIETIENSLVPAICPRFVMCPIAFPPRDCLSRTQNPGSAFSLEGTSRGHAVSIPVGCDEFPCTPLHRPRTQKRYWKEKGDQLQNGRRLGSNRDQTPRLAMISRHL